MLEFSKHQEANQVNVGTEFSENVCSTPAIEKAYVHHVYDAIAPHFSSTRFAKWPKVASFLNSLRPGSVVLDAGCGNGKYLGFNPNCFFIGCDMCPPLIDICAKRDHEVLVADAVNLPYKSNFGDAAICIAVLHHLSTEGRRRKAIKELIRVVRRGGLVLITVWAVEQEDTLLLSNWTPLLEKYNEVWVSHSSPNARNSVAVMLEKIPEVNEEDLHERQDYFVPWHLPYHRAEISSASTSALANGFAKKDDKKGAVVYNRYYHVFVEGELQRLVAGLENVKTIDQFYDKSNWCIILQKT
ncbi:hypothetical protein HPP92_001680 [Vanilla planifolia]|uniref:Methyltransferase type 11 domain-containing protein n=1 Tax=Vanilla planifolia TaxID=51239 RepID=A0A835VLS2_VANPL|nr:hypothetical protein HPP92_001680 [Vanilla planifolia]